VNTRSLRDSGAGNGLDRRAPVDRDRTTLIRVLGDGRFLTIRRRLAPDLSREAEDLGRRGELGRRTRDFVDAPGMYELPRINLAWLYSRCNPLWGYQASEASRQRTSR